MSTQYETRPEVAIFNDDFLVVTRNYTFDLDVRAWGWIQLIAGVIAIAVGFGLYSRATWAGVTAISIASLSAIANFFLIPPLPHLGAGRDRARRLADLGAHAPRRDHHLARCVCCHPGSYPNANAVKDRVLALTAAAAPEAVVLDLSQSTELDLQTVDTLGELADALERDGLELRLADVREPARAILVRSGLAERVRIEPTLDAAVADQLVAVA